MALQSPVARDGFLAANVPEPTANAAAEEPAGYDDRLAGLETRMAVLMIMVAGLYAPLAPEIWMLLRIAAKLGSA
jgi:hypothetical protein